MTYFSDLSHYEYSPCDSHLLNVGWLSPNCEFRRGPVPLAFAYELRLLCEKPINLTRGHHVCEFCILPKDVIAIDPHYEDVWEMFRSGNGEIHVVDALDAVYCAPQLIVHYVAEHQYQPPQEFIEAVLFQRSLRQTSTSI